MEKKGAKKANKPGQTTKAIVMSEAMKKGSAAGNVRSVSIMYHSNFSHVLLKDGCIFTHWSHCRLKNLCHFIYYQKLVTK